MPFAQRSLPTRSTARHPRRRARPVSGTFSSASGGSRLRVAAQLGAWRSLRGQWERRSLGNKSEASKRVRGRTVQRARLRDFPGACSGWGCCLLPVAVLWDGGRGWFDAPLPRAEPLHAPVLANGSIAVFRSRISGLVLVCCRSTIGGHGFLSRGDDLPRGPVPATGKDSIAILVTRPSYVVFMSYLQHSGHSGSVVLSHTLDCAIASSHALAQSFFAMLWRLCTCGHLKLIRQDARRSMQSLP
jgi:hypothetical protein